MAKLAILHSRTKPQPKKAIFFNFSSLQCAISYLCNEESAAPFKQHLLCHGCMVILSVLWRHSCKVIISPLKVRTQTFGWGKGKILKSLNKRRKIPERCPIFYEEMLYWPFQDYYFIFNSFKSNMPEA